MRIAAARRAPALQGAMPMSSTARPAALPRRRRLGARALDASLAQALAGWDRRSAVWVFAYGSLIWQPGFDFDRRVPARVFGYHRRLCLHSVRYRGSFDCPGVVAGLDRGGSCTGIAYRLPAAGARRQLRALWEREMLLGSYAARWLRVHRLDRREALRALAFVVVRDGPHYCGGLKETQLLDVLARARGSRGSSLDYLRRTVQALHACGLRDPHLERLLARASR
jgi:cation transport protein ChaC